MAEELDFESEFQAVLHAVPFVAFSIVLGNGSRYQINDPATVTTGVDFVSILYPSGRTVLRFFNIASFEVHEQPPR
jgi:hypothetical protein